MQEHIHYTIIFKFTVKSDDVYNKVPSPPRQMIKSTFINTVDIVSTDMQDIIMMDQLVKS